MTDPVNHRERIRTILDRARAGDRNHLEQLEAGGAAERWLATVAGCADRDGARTLRRLEDASRRVRGAAVALAPLACDDDQVVAALTAMWAVRGERRLLRRMAAQGRTVAIDRFLDGLADAGHLRELVDSLSFGSAAAVARHLPMALTRPSQRLWRGLAGHHPEALAAALIARWNAHTGEADPVTRQLTAAHHPMIATRAPAAGLALAACLLARGIEPAPTVWTAVVRRRPTEAVALAIAHAARLPSGLFGERARTLAPSLLADIITHAPALLGEPDWLRTAAEDQQRAMATAWLANHTRWPLWGLRLLRYLPDDAARDVGYEAWSRAARDRQGVIGPSQFVHLPRELAAREARRHLHDVVALHTEPVRRITGYARYLPWDELDRELAALRGHPEGDTRAVAVGEQLASVGIYRDDVEAPARALAMVTARKFEQDPVRRVMLDALASWPRAVWQPAHLPAVQQIVRDMLDAADCSGATHAAGERLLVRLFSVDAAWAAAQLATMIKERGQLLDPRLGARLSADEVSAAAPALLEIATTWAAQERFAWLAAMADSLGVHLARVPGLTELVARSRFTVRHASELNQLAAVIASHAPALHESTLADLVVHARRQQWWSAIIALAQSYGLFPGRQPRHRTCRRPRLPAALSDELIHILHVAPLRYDVEAAAVLYRRAPAALDAAIAGLLRADPSLFRLREIRHWAHRHRQELLTPLIGGERITGIRATGATAWLFEFRRGCHRWAPAQVESYAATLAQLIADRERDTPTVLSAIATLASLEWCDQRALCAFASDDRAAVQEKSIRVLARCDAGQGVPTLLACLDDARARFAIYGLRRALFEMAPARAVDLLANAPMRKVTIGKEVVRLLGELRTPLGVARLDELAAGTLHRDVRIALLRALWDHLDRDETWVVFARAVDDPDWITASRLADIPADRLTAVTDAKLAALLARVIARPEPEARIELLRRAKTVAVVDRDRAFLAACRARLASRYDDEVTAAMSAVMARSTEHDVDALGAALAELTADPRALHVAFTTLVGHDVRSRDSWCRIARAATDAVIADPRWAKLALDATGALADGPALVATLDRLAAARTVDHDAIAAAAPALARLRPEHLGEVSATLAVHHDAAVRRIAVIALGLDAAGGRGWTAPRRALLATLRHDADLTVAGAAARLWPPREDDVR